MSRRTTMLLSGIGMAIGALLVFLPDRRAERGRATADANPADVDEESVDSALDDSFPASDPPAWTGTTAQGGT